MVQMMTQGREALLKKLEEQYGREEISPLLRKHERFMSKHPDADDAEWTKALSLDALGMLDEDESFWTFVAARLLLAETYKEAADKRGVVNIDEVYQAFPAQIEKLVERGLYHSFLIEKYTAEERQAIANLLNPEKDELFTYIGLKTLLDRYVARDFDKTPLELPQERWLVIAMTLMQDEKVDRLKKIEEAYWAMSSLYMTTATPTLSNAGKTHGQLSSCFIDTVDDSLQGIYDSNTDVATLSKFGGGIGIYMGKVRSRGSSIRGFKGASSGVIPWIKQLNNTAVSVDQLGQRQGAIAVYLDVWHKDIFPFLDLKLNNGDERMRAHDIFTGVCLPDIFMEAVEAREEWHLFDPHEVRTVMGFDLEDSYDEKRGEGSFREKYLQCVNNPIL
ncbi:MAG: ribonucleoside-diphosphate reductase subunit alpha, partial [Kurthia sp.]|nr:ribonucleoside-diphosphate reductase subunit alpha [Kurthia sp.]